MIAIEREKSGFDQRALPVAAAAREKSGAEAIIIFGSRARGDYEEGRSDIDLILLQEDEPDIPGKSETRRCAEALAAEQYGSPVPVQLIWIKPAEFRRNRRYRNSVETRAAKEGIIMPRNPESYHRQEYEGESAETEHQWTDYETRIEDAGNYLEGLKLFVERKMDDRMIGRQAHGALEHALKALIAAHGSEYPKSHYLGALIGEARKHDPRMNHFELQIHPDIYSEYAGAEAYGRNRRTERLSAQPDYLEKTIKDAEFIAARARSIRERNEPDRQE